MQREVAVPLQALFQGQLSSCVFQSKYAGRCVFCSEQASRCAQMQLNFNYINANAVCKLQRISLTTRYCSEISVCSNPTTFAEVLGTEVGVDTFSEDITSALLEDKESEQRQKQDTYGFVGHRRMGPWDTVKFDASFPHEMTTWELPPCLAKPM